MVCNAWLIKGFPCNWLFCNITTKIIYLTNIINTVTLHLLAFIPAIKPLVINVSKPLKKTKGHQGCRQMYFSQHANTNISLINGLMPSIRNSLQIMSKLCAVCLCFNELPDGPKMLSHHGGQ